MQPGGRGLIPAFSLWAALGGQGDHVAWRTFVLFGLLPPVGLWVLWRIQRVSVETLRLGMVKLVRHAPALYHVVSWFGTLLHELSHALVLLAAGLGIRGVSVRSEEGHVTPARMPSTSIGSVGLILAALAPMFFVPALVLAAALVLLDGSLLDWGTPSFGEEALRGFADSVLGFPWALLRVLAGLDVTDWRQAGFLALVLLGAPGTRPSFVKGDGLLGGGGDIGVLRGQLRRRPWLMALVPGLLLVAYYVLLPLAPAAYWWPFQALWATAMTGIVIALLGAFVWWTAARNTRTVWWAGWLPVVLLVGVQVLGRTLSGWADRDLAWINGVSLAAWSASAWLLSFAAPRRDAIDRAIKGR